MAKNTSGSQGANRQASLLKESQALAKALGLEYENIVDLQEMILNNQIKSTDELLKQVKAAREAQTRVENELNLEKEKTEQKEKQRAAEKDIKDLADELAKPLRKIANMTDEILENDLARIQKAKELGVISEKEANLQENLLKTYTKLSKNPIVKSGFSEAANTLDSMQSSIDDFMKKLPGGEMISKAFGLDKLSEKIQKSILAGGNLGIVGVVAAVGILYAVLSDVTKEAEEFSKATGVTFGQARQIADEARKAQASYSNQLATQKDILAVQQETIKAFGTTAMLTGEQAANVADLGKSFGYGAQQAASVNNAFMSMGASATTAYEAQQSLAAEALKAGVNVGTVTQDIAENAKTTAKYFGGNVQALKDAAIQAAKMGMSLNTMSKISDKLLDVQSSLAAQFEFQALSGRQIDLDLARQLALEGDIAGAAKEVLGAVGSTAEFNSMNMLQRKKLAEAVGMEVDELQKSLIIQEKLGDLTDDQKAAMSGLNLSAAELNNLSAEQIQQKLADQQALEKGAAAFDTMKNQLTSALIPLAETLGTVFSALAPIIKTAFLPIEWAGMAVQYIVDLFKQFPAIMGTILGLATAIWAMENQALIVSTFKNAQYEIGFALLVAQEAIETAILAVKNSQTLAIIKSIGKSAIDGALSIGRAIGSIFSSFAMIPFGLGIPLAIAAVGGLVALSSKFLNVGDLAMGASNGPIVANPREGTIFQGTKNDEVAMGPGVIGAAQGGSGTTVVQQSGGSDPALITGLMAKLDQLIAATNKPTPAVINWGDRDTTQVANEVAADRTTRATYNGR